MVLEFQVEGAERGGFAVGAELYRFSRKWVRISA